MSVIAGIKKFWNDPVWSKVIAVGITGAVTLFYTAVSSWSPTESISQMYITVSSVVIVVFAVCYILVQLYFNRKVKTLVFLSSGGTCRDPMAKVIASKLFESRKLKHLLKIKAVGLGPLSNTEASYAAKYIIKEICL